MVTSNTLGGNWPSLLTMACGSPADSQSCHLFNCLGDLNVKDTRLGIGYVKSGEIPEIFGNVQNRLPLANIYLFGKVLDKEAAFHCRLNKLFQRVRKFFLVILHSATKTDTRLFSIRPPNAKIRDINYFNQRKEICHLLNLLRQYITVTKSENFSLSRRFAENVSKNLLLLRSLVKNLSDLPNHVLALSSSPKGNQCTYAAYHLFHLQLDISWYHVTILYYLEQMSCTNSSEETDLSYKQQLDMIVRQLLVELLNASLFRFEKMAINELKVKTPFLCSCVKELWLLVQIYIDKRHRQNAMCDFWQEVNILLDTVSLKPSFENIEKKNCATGSSPTIRACSNPIGFNLWMLMHLAQLHGYTECGEYEGPSCNRVVTNYQYLEKILKVTISPHHCVTEAQLRVYITFVCDLVTRWWPPHIEPLVIFWQYFNQRLNNCFFLQGASPETVAIVRKSGSSLVKQISSLLDDPGQPHTNSYELFLHFLGTYLQRSPGHWQQVKGRIYSKFSPSKMQSLKEIGIYHISSLFLTLAMTVDVKEVGNKMQELLNILMTTELDVARHHMLWKSHLALIQLHIAKGMDIASVVKPLISDVTNVTTQKSHDTLVLLETFIEDLQEIASSSTTLNLSEYTLITDWIEDYLSSTCDCCKLMDVLLVITRKILNISEQGGMIEYDACNSQLTLMYHALCKYVYPYLKAQFMSSEPAKYNEQIADLAESLTLLSLNRANVGVISLPFTVFFDTFALNANPMNAKLSLRYMSCLLQRSNIFSELTGAYGGCDLKIIQTWFRCLVYCGEGESEDLQEFTHIVCTLPAVVTLSQSTSIKLESERDPMFAFVRMLGHAYQLLNRNSAHTDQREQWLKYVSPAVQNFETMLRNRAVSEHVVCRIFQLAASFMLFCGSMIYTKSNPNCIYTIVMKKVLLPMEIYKPETQLHPYLINALCRTLHLFVRGIIHLNNVIKDNVLMSDLKKLIVQYFTRLAGKQGRSSSYHSHPLMRCFNESEDKEMHRLVLDIICSSFVKIANSKTDLKLLDFKGGAKVMDTEGVNHSSSLALMFILDLLHQKKFNCEMVELVMSCSLANIFSVIIFGNKCPALKRQAFNILNGDFINEVISSPKLSQLFQSVILSVSRQYLPHYNAHLILFLNKLCEMVPSIMSTTIPKLKEIIDLPGIDRGFEYKTSVRRGLENLEKILSAQTNPSNVLITTTNVIDYETST